ncbi:cell division protein FtsX [Pseudooceanicola batsensis HTCC2597]|uniref:Cell division protein FtsX n=1 Tax=Pseudooceanicola batsensis (strain ATCC BAA-863 / DSM 15984 / KCTC 12145 / HTCC2597) TaxID=252305 RepID=A3TV57_PSEBH|nr:FtsX-like permease family protein [Pseudooceanicola batsensis]EAQ04403.1 cell division protein FtsX [Pseudooceanicola batsensis HTCC2597]
MRGPRVIGDLVSGDGSADRVVPPSGQTAHLTLFAAAVMAFLAVFALALSLSTGRLADRWGEDLARASTVRISAPGEQMQAQTAAALRVLETTEGVASARALDATEQRALLAPWFGPEVPVEDLPVPQLIEVIETDAGFDAAGLRLRLSAEAPGAVLDDHTRWRRPLVRAAERLRALGYLSILLIGGAMAAIITLAASAALSANAQVIGVLRLVGAEDRYVARAFVRRFTLRTLAGAAAGTLAGCLALLLLPSSGEGLDMLTGLGFRGAEWLLPLLLPPVAGLVAYAATRRAALRVLGELT